MTLTALDKNTALIVVDLQKGIVSMPNAHPMEPVVKHARTLADAFRRHALPVVLVNVTGVPPGRVERPRNFGERAADWADLIPELDQQPQDHLVTKRARGAFTHTDLDAYLKKQGVTQVVVVGVATSAGVESTARHAHELGYNVTFASDAMTDLSAEAHTHSLTQIFPRLGETGTTAQIIDLIEQRA